MNTEQEREAFEDWILPGKDKNLPGHQNTLARYPSGNYMTYSIAKQWDAWQARAAIEADRKRRGEPVADGWKLVPEEPTMEMLYAARKADKEYQARMGLPNTIGVGAYDHYVAMLEAAPQPAGAAHE